MDTYYKYREFVRRRVFFALLTTAATSVGLMWLISVLVQVGGTLGLLISAPFAVALVVIVVVAPFVLAARLIEIIRGQ